ncbi:hypothetical protein LCL89_09830 [Halobacillus yeomjeoni]|uniref:hypothetical protein n=1 Tax=Halobacillus yeomjeoni TaxID=311194 RepID=UPI001CD6D0B8|nr:hypothetical protein [Halobacillus yeomjeoni]MCA0984345.1 hypothetical protein [Halobacillus yeomjeoni]
MFPVSKGGFYIRRNIYWGIGTVMMVLSIFTYLYFQDAREEERQWKLFINRFYYSVDQSIIRLDSLIDHKPEGEVLKEHIHRLNEEFTTAHVTLENGNHYVSDRIPHTRFFRKAPGYLYGISSGSEGGGVPPLAEDQRLDEQEINRLKTLRSYLSEAKSDMYSEETGQENPEMTKEAFQKMINDHLDQYPNEIYLDGYQ